MVIKSKLSLQDYINANFILLYSKISVLIFTAIIALFLLVILIGAIFLPNFSFGQILFPLVMLTVFPLSTYVSAKRNYLSNTMTGETIEYEFDNNHFTVKGETFDSQLPWENINKVTEKKNWILVWQNRLNANPIPKRDISSIQLQGIKEILASRHVKNNLK